MNIENYNVTAQKCSYTEYNFKILHTSIKQSVLMLALPAIVLLKLNMV